MPFCVEAYGCAMGFGAFGDAFTVNPGDCTIDAQTVTGLLWQMRNPPLPAGVSAAAVLPAANCYSSAADIALVQEVQGAAGLAANGIVDDATLSALTVAANAVQGGAGMATGTLPPAKVTEPPLTVTGSAGSTIGAGGFALAALAGFFFLGGKKKRSK